MAEVIRALLTRRFLLSLIAFVLSVAVLGLLGWIAVSPIPMRGAKLFGVGATAFPKGDTVAPGTLTWLLTTMPFKGLPVPGTRLPFPVTWKA